MSDSKRISELNTSISELDYIMDLVNNIQLQLKKFNGKNLNSVLNDMCNENIGKGLCTKSLEGNLNLCEKCLQGLLDTIVNKAKF